MSLIDESLQESERTLATTLALRDRQLAAIMSACFDGLIVHEEGRILSANAAATTMFGYGPDGLNGHALVDLLSPEGREEGQRWLARGLADNPLVNGPAVLSFCRRDGSRGWAEVIGTNTEHAGRSARMLAVRDLTDHYAAHERLRASEERYRRLIELLPEGALVHQDGVIVFANAAAAAILGAPDGPSLVGLPIMGSVHPDFRHVAQRRVAEVLATGNTAPLCEQRWMRFDRVVIDVEVTSTAIAHDDDRAILLVLRDVTARKQAERARIESELKLRAIIEHTDDLIFVKDPAGRYLLVNPALAEFFNLTEAELLARHDRDVLDPCMYPAIRVEERAIMASRAHVTNERVFVGRGRQRHVSMTKFPFYGPHGEVLGVVGVGRDITQQREIDRMKEEFIATISHELRTPLNTICCSLDALASGKLAPEKGERLMAIAANNTDRLIRIINDLLDIQSIAYGKLAVVRKAIALGPLIDEALEGLRPILDQAGLTLEYLRDDAQVVADGDRVIQALSNLLGNAVKFSPPESTVTVTLQRRTDEVWLSVVDAGRGIPEDKLEAIFERFVQLDPADHTLKRGAGLGLAICRAIAEAHDGRIWAESRPGAGARFVLALPLDRPPSDAA